MGPLRVLVIITQKWPGCGVYTWLMKISVCDMINLECDLMN